MTPIEETDLAIILVAGLEVTADLQDKPELVNACVLVLDGLLDVRLHLPQQRTSPETGGAACTASPSTGSARPPS